MITSIKKLIHKQEFFPGFLGIFVNPFFFARRGLVKNISIVAPAINGRILDVGCGSKPYKSLFTFTEYIGIDIENPGHDHTSEDIDFYYDGNTLPFEDASFDSVITNQVFEHVFNPTRFLSEITRVLRPGGKLLLTVPFVWDEHEQPFDFARYSSFGIKHSLQTHGFEVVEFRKSVQDLRVVFQLGILYIYKITRSNNVWVNRLLVLFLISPITITGLLLSAILPSNDDLYLDNIVVAKKRI
jgi:SAM-dependent methyltransferase